MSETQQSSHPSWLRIGLLGCGGTIGLVILFLAGIAGLTFWGYRGAIQVREEVDRQYGAFDSYRVPQDGRIPSDRMNRFLAVRHALMPRCAEVTDATGRFKAVDDMAGQAEPDVGELFSRVGRVLRLWEGSPILAVWPFGVLPSAQDRSRERAVSPADRAMQRIARTR